MNTETLWAALEAVGLSIAFLLLVFVPMEKVFPAKKGQKVFRKGWRLDLFFFLGQYLLWGALVTWALSYFSFWLDDIVPATFRAGVAAQPWWLQAIEVVVLSDFIIYWGHRLQHNNEFLWRFHKVHHSAEHLDWLAAHREHPLDSIYTIGLINLPAFILGFPLETIAGFIAFRGIWAIYIHSNVRLNIGPLRWFVGAPELHHWHHDKNRDAGNYANISSLINMLVGKKGLAKTSATPGKTQLINHFKINDTWFLVDLPGYGFAKVSKDQRAKWDGLIKNYIANRDNLMCVFVLVDSRIEPQQNDLDFINLLGENGIPMAIIFTKADKQKPAKTQVNVDVFCNKLLEEWEEVPQYFISSSENKTGRDEILGYIDAVNKEFK